MCGCKKNEAKALEDIDPILELFLPNHERERLEKQRQKVQWPAAVAKQLREANQYTPEFVLQRKMARFR
jgi:hypothetical protein